MKAAWPMVPLAAVCDRLVDGDWIETKDQGGSDYRLLQVSNVGVGTFRETGNFRWITQETFDRLRCSQINIGDILIARMPDPTGRAWYVSDLPWPAVTAVDVAIATPNLEVVDGRFLAYHLNSPSQLRAVAANATGTTRLRISRRVLAGMPVPCPPVPLQRRIAAVLAAYDDLIENNLRRIEALEEMAQALYREWFIDFRFPGHEDVALVDSPVGPIPTGWEVSDLGSSAEWISGGTPKTTEPAYWQGSVPWITSGSLTSFLLDRSDRRLTEQGVTAGSRMVPRNTLVIVVRGMSLAKEFRHGIAEVPLTFGQDCKGLIARPPLDPLYLAYSVSVRAAEIQGMVEYSAHGTGKLSTDRLKALLLLHPPEKVQTEFVQHVDRMRGLMSNLRAQTDNLRVAKDLLLPRLLTGEIDVSDLDIDTDWLVA